jgi:hypothetical protein
MYGGYPSNGVCNRCVEKGENTRDFAAAQKALLTSTPQHPSLPQMAASFAGSMVGWAKGGFQVTDEETLAERLAICKGCEFWDQSGYGGTGRCQNCGCSTWGQLRMATKKCPIEKWGPVTPS